MSDFIGSGANHHNHAVLSHTRFRREGRTGTDAYSRLYSKDNCKPMPKKSPIDTVGQSMRKVLEQGLESAPAKYIADTTSKIKKWTHFRTAVRVFIAVTLAVLTILGALFSLGYNAMKRTDTLSRLGVYYTSVKGFSAKASAPKADSTVTTPHISVPLSGADLTGSDLSAADAGAAEKADEPSDTCSVFASASDAVILPQVTGGSFFGTAVRAGSNEAYASRLNIELYAHIEAGAAELDPLVYSRNGNTDIAFSVPPTEQQLTTAGCHQLQVVTGGKYANVLLIVEDTTAPVVSESDLSIWLGDSVSPEDFIVSVTDASPIIVEYVNYEPNLLLSGEQLVYLNIRDIYGNDAELIASQLTIQEDKEPPVISGARNQTVVIGSTISYKQGVTVSDNRDSADKITLSVDNSAVDPNKTGTYDVIYTAVDSSGNIAAVTVQFKFGTESEISTDLELEKYVKKVASSIFTSNMSDTQKVRAIYNWCRSRIAYSGHSTKDNWKNAAIRGFKNRSGDCYTYYACAKALLEYCGIKNIDVVKVKNSSSESSHYWSLVDVGTGYYHLDCTPRVGGFNGFMRTDAQIKSYSSAHKNSHRFDASLYPATPTTAFDAD